MASTNDYGGLSKSRYRFNKKRLLFWGAFILFIFILLAGIRFVSIFKSLQNQEVWAQTLSKDIEGSVINYLFFGVDYWGEKIIADKLVVVQYDTSSEEIKALFIPGNTLIELPKHEGTSLGMIYSIGGSHALIEKVESIIASPIHHYIKFNYQGFVPLIDTFGGIEVSDFGEVVDQALLPEKISVMNGNKFYKYYIGMDAFETSFGQLERQRKAILAVINNTVEYINFWTTYSVARAMASYLETDLTWNELNTLYYDFKNISFTDVKLIEIPGEPVERFGEVYWYPTELPSLFFAEAKEDNIVDNADISVEVLNGSGVEGAAVVLGEMLKKEGFSVVNIGNADHFNYEYTKICWGESKEKAIAIAEYIPEAILTEQPVAELETDVIIIIGKNFSLSN